MARVKGLVVNPSDAVSELTDLIKGVVTLCTN